MLNATHHLSRIPPQLRKKSKTPSRRTIINSSSASPPMQTPATGEQQQQQHDNNNNNIKKSIYYHTVTKHSYPSSFARGPHNLDWSNQPNPFLRFLSSPSISLPHPSSSSSSPHSLHYPLLFSSFPSPPLPFSILSLSYLLFHSLSLSAWKSTSFSTWSLRVNPSSGNLHPTESHLISPSLPSSHPPFIAHYSPKDHSLQLRSFLPSPLLPNSLLLAFSSILWREAWKYGERAFRYCNHDVGHAIAAAAISAASLGWDSRLLDALSHSDLDSLLAIRATYPPPPQLPDRPVRGRFPWIEFQHPDCVLAIFPFGSEVPVDYSALRDAISRLSDLEWLGKPSPLSKDHVCWDLIYKTAEAVKKPYTPSDGFSINPFRPSGLISKALYKDFTVWDVVRKRRSAVDMDGVHMMERDTFYQILLHCLPSGELRPEEKQGKQLALPFRVLTWDAEVHAVLFVHRVADLPQGLYFLVRNEDHFESLKQAMRQEFEWERPIGCPAGLPLYRLAKGDCQELAKQLSCHQEIASDGCFSLGMVARFEPVLREKGAWMYPRLFWESGILGQVLYLESHAVGISATGIGCYFDDAVHQVLGLDGLEFQSLYHFTIGSPVLDKRIMSLPAYPGPDIDA
ncbi:putative nitroreductase [Dioscorea sansibarensis]